MDEQEKPAEQGTAPQVIDVKTSPAVENIGANASVQESRLPEAVPEESAPSEEKPVEESKLSEPKKKNSIVAIVVAVIIALILASLATYLYLRGNKTPKEPVNTGTAASQAQQAATVKDVDRTSQDIDMAISSADSANDVYSGDLTDSTLGL